ncbi:MAG: His/Gly/Thr/Pro-type tRNA ligase C-terminal domain-containing protein, partial [Melioribacteraceae bacterium]
GIERILLACENEKSFSIEDEKLDLFLVTIEKGLENFAYQTAVTFRRKGLTVDLDYLNRSVKAQMREANRTNSKFVLLIGGDEFARGEVVLKNMSNGEQKIFSKDDTEKIFLSIKEN